ncbi:N/A [soil metagenome]
MNEPLRVLHLNSGNLYGGVETFLLTLAECRDFVPRMQPEFGLCFGGRQEDELRASGCPVHSLGEVRFSRPWTVWRARRNLKLLLQTRSIDVVVCHQPWIQALFGKVVSNCGRVYVAYFHGIAGHGWQEHKASRTRPQLAIAPSQYTLDTVRDWFPTTTRAVVHNPLPTRMRHVYEPTPIERDQQRAALGAGPEDVVIFTASRVEAVKGSDLLIEALTALRDYPRWQFWYAGAPQRPHEHDLFDRMKQMVHESGIANRFRFLGSRADVPELMKLVDVYAQANRGPEGFGLSYLEAAYSYVPIVTTQPGSLGEMVDDTNGIIVPANNVTAMAEALCNLIRDPHRRQTLGAGGRAKAIRQCDPQQQLSRLADLFLAARGMR